METIRDRYDGWYQRLVTDALSVNDGVLDPPEGAGLGTGFDVSLLDHPETSICEMTL